MLFAIVAPLLLGAIPPLQHIEPYITILDKDQYQSFDAECALAEGVDPETIDLVREVVEFQNLLIDRSYGDQFDHMALEGFPEIQEFQKSYPLSYGPHACGNFSYPVPAANPTRTTLYNLPDPVAVLFAAGFHRTAGYACESARWECRSDFTRGRGYVSAYGTCPSPAFRDHGWASPTGRYLSVQFGEPNPEIHSYIWPYWDWGLYVKLWHENVN